MILQSCGKGLFKVRWWNVCMHVCVKEIDPNEERETSARFSIFKCFGYLHTLLSWWILTSRDLDWYLSLSGVCFSSPIHLIIPSHSVEISFTFALKRTPLRWLPRASQSAHWQPGAKRRLLQSASGTKSSVLTWIQPESGQREGRELHGTEIGGLEIGGQGSKQKGD